MQPLPAPPHLRRLVALTAVTLTALLAPSVAQAAPSSVAVDNHGLLSYTAAGASNHLVATASGSTIQLRDTGAGVSIAPGSHCSGSGQTVSCTGVASLRLTMGDGDNFVDSTSVPLNTNVTAGAGADHIATGTRSDLINSGDGADWIDGGTGSDALNGGPGDDWVGSRDGSFDGVGCGGGHDSGSADPIDAVAPDCEAVDKSATPPPGDGSTGGGSTTTGGGTSGGSGTTTAPADPAATGGSGDQPSCSGTPTGTAPGAGNGQGLDLAGALNLQPPIVPPQTAGVSPAGVALVRVICPADSGGCKGTVDIYLPAAGKPDGHAANKAAAAASGNGTRIGRARFRARAGTKPLAPVRLNRRGRRRILRHRRKTRGKVVVTTRDAAGRSRTTTQTITLSPRRTPPRTKGRKR
jgi:hypothetical protein